MNNLPMTPSLALLRDVTIHYKLIAASIHRLSTHLMCDVPEVKHSPLFIRIRAIGKAALRGTRSIVSAVIRPWSRHTPQH